MQGVGLAKCSPHWNQAATASSEVRLGARLAGRGRFGAGAAGGAGGAATAAFFVRGLRVGVIMIGSGVMVGMTAEMVVGDGAGARAGADERPKAATHHAAS